MHDSFVRRISCILGKIEERTKTIIAEDSEDDESTMINPLFYAGLGKKRLNNS